MITEQICLDVVCTLYGRSSTIRLQLNLDDRPGATPSESASVVENARPPGELYRELLSQYSLADVDEAIRWLEFGGYVSYTGFGVIAPRQVMCLTDKGVALARAGALSESERKLVYREDPYAAFIARQFRDEDTALYEYLEKVLQPIGIRTFDGRVDGVEAFRGEILRKIRLARFFICILTRQAELQEGGFASSVWLYQEIGAAVALGKKPLVLVENGLSDHFAGELQKNYEYIPFTRADFEEPFQEAGRRVQNDLVSNYIPVRGVAT